MNLTRSLALLPLLVASALVAQSQVSPQNVSPARARAEFAQPIVLAPDDVSVFREAPAGFNAREKGIPHGRIETLSYASKVTGTTRQAKVYLPPGYTPSRKYPVLYLLHGIGGDDTEWIRFVSPQNIFDNLLAKGRMVPMIVVFPNGRALPDDRAQGNPFTPRNVEGFARFQPDLLHYLIPAVQATYSTYTDRLHRALAGLSMGGGQTLDIGLSHLGTFAWLGAFSSAPNTEPPAKLLPDPAAARRELKLLYLSSGNRDGLIRISQGVHRYLKAHQVPHVWNVDASGHDAHTWGDNLYHFVQRIFR